MTLQRLARYSLAFLLLLFHHTLLHAQKRTVTGTVFSKDTKEALPGVTVNVKGTTNSVVTDSKGYFSITPPARMKEVILTFSFVGYDSKSMRVDSSLALSVEMTMNNKSMNDVIVVGYGTQKRSNVLGSVAVVSGKELEDLPAANLSTSLINTVPGVSVNQTSGKPGRHNQSNDPRCHHFLRQRNDQPPLCHRWSGTYHFGFRFGGPFRQNGI